MRPETPRLSLLLLIALAASPVALAHHPLGGMTPETFMQGLLSGLGHPIIGLDHLAFVLGAGLLALVLGGRLWLPLAFVAGTLAGTGIHLLALNLPGVEMIIALSVLLLGAGLLANRQLSVQATAGLLALAGIFHGYAYGETVIGAEVTPILAYLLGFAVIQSALALGTALLADRYRASRPWLPLGGSVVTAAGALAVVGQWV